MFILSTHMSVYHEEPGTEVTGAVELSCEWWELNPGPLHEQKVLITTRSTITPMKTSYHRS